MKYDINDFLMKIIPEIFEEHPELFLEKDDMKDLNYFDQRIYLWQKNQMFLNEVIKKIPDSFKKKYSVKELYCMQKLYVLYPDNPPNDLLGLPWDCVKVIINILSVEKRSFYINACKKYSWNVRELRYYIVCDLFEKYKYLCEKQNCLELNILDKLLQYEFLIFE